MSDEDLRGRKIPGGGSPVIGSPGSLTTTGQPGGQQTANASGLGVTQTYGEVVITDGSPALYVSQAYAEVVRLDTTPEFRCSTVYAEVVVERDYAGWESFLLDDPTGADDIIST